jgi:hypothetical protein
VDVTDVVVEVDVALVRLSLVATEVCIEVVEVSVEADVKDDVTDPDSMEDVVMAVVELEISCDVSEEDGFVLDAVVETGSVVSVETVDASVAVTV